MTGGRSGSGVDDAALRSRATELGVSVEVLARLLDGRRALVEQVSRDPRAWGLDLLPASSPRRDVVTEFRRLTRLQGALADSLLQGWEPLLRLVPDPLTAPDGTPLPTLLEVQARLPPDAARDVAGHLRAAVQLRLGRALGPEAVERAVREVSWEHQLDPARIEPRVAEALRSVVAA